jgi:hypothetical protein
MWSEGNLWFVSAIQADRETSPFMSCTNVVVNYIGVSAYLLYFTLLKFEF